MQLIIKDVDITDSNQSMRSCKYKDYAGGHADVLQIIFNDTFDLWRKWGLVKGDKIRVANYGIDTGDMYISDIGIDNGSYKIKALSTPASCRKEKSWTRENIKLTEICSEVSKELGFELHTYDITDFTYKYIERIEQSPTRYLESLLVRVGYLLKIFNNQIIISSEKILEQNKPNISVHIEDFITNPTLVTSDANIIASVENIYHHENGMIKSKASSGLDGKKVILHYPVGSIGEGERFCKNIMRYDNKYEFTGSGILSSSGITAGITINLEGDFADWKGTNFVYEVYHDLVYDRQTIKFRKPIRGDY